MVVAMGMTVVVRWLWRMLVMNKAVVCGGDGV